MENQFIQFQATCPSPRCFYLHQVTLVESSGEILNFEEDEWDGTVNQKGVQANIPGVEPILTVPERLMS